MVGASFSNKETKHFLSPTTITAWFNNDAFHSAGLSLALAMNTVYKTILGQEYNIRFTNYPLPYTSTSKMREIIRGHSLGFQFAFNVGFSMSFVSSLYILFYVKERACKSKHLQFVSGVKVYIFWIISFICDLITFIVTIAAIVVTFALFQEEGFRSLNDLTIISLILFYFGFSMLPMIYFASYLFDTPSTGYARMTFFSVITGMIFLSSQI